MAENVLGKYEKKEIILCCNGKYWTIVLDLYIQPYQMQTSASNRCRHYNFILGPFWSVMFTYIYVSEIQCRQILALVLLVQISKLNWIFIENTEYTDFKVLRYVSWIKHIENDEMLWLIVITYTVYAKIQHYFLFWINISTF